MKNNISRFYWWSRWVSNHWWKFGWAWWDKAWIKQQQPFKILGRGGLMAFLLPILREYLCYWYNSINHKYIIAIIYKPYSTIPAFPLIHYSQVLFWSFVQSITTIPFKIAFCTTAPVTSPTISPDNAQRIFGLYNGFFIYLTCKNSKLKLTFSIVAVVYDWLVDLDWIMRI